MAMPTPIIQVPDKLSPVATASSQGDVPHWPPLVADIAGVEAQANKGATNGYAPLDSGSKVPVANLPAATALAAGTLAAADFSKLANVPDNTGEALNAKQTNVRTGRTVTGATDTLLATDTDTDGVTLVYYTDAGGCAITLQKYATTPYVAWRPISVMAGAAGGLTITPVSPATINGAGTAVTVPSGTAASLVPVAQDVWRTIPVL